MFFKVQVLRVQVFMVLVQSPGPDSGSRVPVEGLGSGSRVQGPGPGYRGSLPLVGLYSFQNF